MSDVRQQYRPVSMPYRVGEHTALGEWASVNRIPAAATASRCGVEVRASAFMNERSPRPRSSASTITMWGWDSSAAVSTGASTGASESTGREASPETHAIPGRIPSRTTDRLRTRGSIRIAPRYGHRRGSRKPNQTLRVGSKPIPAGIAGVGASIAASIEAIGIAQ